MADHWSDLMDYDKRLVDGTLRPWERNRVRPLDHKTNESFCHAMYLQACRHVDEWHASEGLEAPQWLIDKRSEWHQKWLQQFWRVK